MKDYYLTEVRPTLANIKKLEGLVDYLKDNNLLLLHEGNHVKVKLRDDSTKTIAQFHLL